MNKIMATFRISDATAKQYDQIMQDLDRSGLYKVRARSHHVMATSGDGFRVVDVWESPEALQEFFGTLGPILVKNGVHSPEPEILPVHNEVF